MEVTLAERASKPAPRARDREGTEARILEAAARVLARDGFAVLGINTVAREAGVDKQLLYRYFGGLDGLLERLGADLDLWLGDAVDSPIAADRYGAVMADQLRRHLAAVRANQLVQAVLAWELVENSEAVDRLGHAKSEAVRGWFGRVRTAAGPPPEGLDAPAINAVLLAAVHHLTLRARTAGDFAGLDLTTPESWNRIEGALEALCLAVYGEADGASAPDRA